MIRSRRAAALLFTLALALTSLGVSPPSLAAPTDTPGTALKTAPETKAAYDALHDAITTARDSEAVFENAMKAVENAYRAAPEMQALEAESPGIISHIVKAMRPAMRDRTRRIERLYRPALIALYKRHLTPQEASDLATFYNSRLGRRILYQASARYSPDATLSNLQSDGHITQEQIDADLGRATRSVLNSLSAQDRNAMLAAMRDTPALLKLRAVFDEVRALRVQMENEPPTPEEEERISGAIRHALNGTF